MSIGSGRILPLLPLALQLRAQGEGLGGMRGPPCGIPSRAAGRVRREAELPGCADGMSIPACQLPYLTQASLVEVLSPGIS